MYRVRQSEGLGSCTFPNNLSEAKAQWCLQFPSLCSTATYKAAVALCSPDTTLPQLTGPTSHLAVGEGLSTVPVPYPCSDGSLATAAANCPAFSAAVDAVIADQQTAWDAANRAAMAAAQAHLDAIGTAQGQECLVGSPVQNADGTWSCSRLPGTNWLLYGGIAAGVLALLMIRGQGERRGR
jgi:hypothetical protein